MERIAFLEDLGLRVAALSDRSDGDCGYGAVSCAARSRFLAALGLSEATLRTARQVHGTTFLEAASLGAQYGIPSTARAEADGLITTAQDNAIGVFVADCVPVWLYSPSCEAAALVHAGRAGTFQQITALAAQRLCTQHGADPQDLYAWIGPSAGPCCYEVSPGLVAEANALGIPCRGRHLDLWAANERQLRAVGLPAAHIGCSAVCTICSGRYHSYRAQQTTARNLAVLQR